VILKLGDSELLQLLDCIHLYSVWRTHTNVCFNLCDLKRCRPLGTCDMYRVGRCIVFSFSAFLL